MGRSDGFVNLHVHTEYSTLDGLARVEHLCRRAAEMGQPAVAMTDHGSLGGAWKFAKAAKAAGIKAIPGQEIYLAIPDDYLPEDARPGPDGKTARFHRNEITVARSGDVDSDSEAKQGGKLKRNEHLTVLATNETGWQNLVRITNASQDSYWYKPLADRDLLAEHSEGLIALTGCLGGPVAGRIADGDVDAARANLAFLRDAFGSDNVYVEIMDHGIADERAVLPVLIELADEFDLPLVATNDSHYVVEGQAEAHEAWLCVGTGKKLSDDKRFAFHGSGYHLRSAAEMREIAKILADDPATAGVPDIERRWLEAVENSLVVADRVAGRVLPEPHLRLPQFPVPTNQSSQDYLYDEVKAGAVKRYGELKHRPDVKERLRHELDVIHEKGFDDYFLIVRDVIDWAREQGIRVGPGRGSAAGSAVSYCIGIVNVDPIENNLLFERFLDPERVGMPDIDTDFEEGRRGEVVQYLARRYGTETADYVARIGTFGVSRSKASIKDAARVLERRDIGDQLNKLIPVAGGKPLELAVLTDEKDSRGADFRDLAEADPAASEVLAVAADFENVVAREGIHACGVLVSDEPLAEVVPLRRDRAKGGAGGLVTQWDGKDVEDYGLLKLDVLGLRNLDVISEAIRQIRDSTGEEIDPDNLPTDPDDQRVRKTWEMLGAGHTSGVFQLASSGMTKLAQRVQPTSLSDLSALVALYRPGPLGAGFHDRYALRKQGEEEVDYSIFTDDPDEQDVIASVLGETFGIACYQEQLMRVSGLVAGFGAAKRNRLRKAISKKVGSEFAEIREQFFAGATSDTDDDGNPKRVFAESTAEKLWTVFESSASYLFNASHSFAYGLVAYITAFLKANWPGPYGAALLSATEDDEQRLAALNALKREGVSVLGPDVNTGGAATSVDADGNVRLGLGEVFGVKTNAAVIIAEREANGPFAGIADLVNRVKGVDGKTGKTRAMASNIFEALVESGSCDSFGFGRMGMCMVVRALRDNPDLPVPDVEWGRVERAQRERARLGIVVSEHPLADGAVKGYITQWRDPRSGDKPISVRKAKTKAANRNVAVIGVVSTWHAHNSRSGMMANFVLEGSADSVECVMFSRTYKRLEAAGRLPRVGQIVGVSGKTNESKVYRRKEPQRLDFDDEDGLDGGGDVQAVDEDEVKRELIVDSIFVGTMKDAPREVPRPSPVRRLRRTANLTSPDRGEPAPAESSDGEGAGTAVAAVREPPAPPPWDVIAAPAGSVLLFADHAALHDSGLVEVNGQRMQLWLASARPGEYSDVFEVAGRAIRMLAVSDVSAVATADADPGSDDAATPDDSERTEAAVEPTGRSARAA